jgi:hypothetical protein
LLCPPPQTPSSVLSPSGRQLHTYGLNVVVIDISSDEVVDSVVFLARLGSRINCLRHHQAERGRRGEDEPTADALKLNCVAQQTIRICNNGAFVNLAPSLRRIAPNKSSS